MSDPPDTTRPTRRRLLKGAGATLAGLTAPTTTSARTAEPTPQDHEYGPAHMTEQRPHPSMKAVYEYQYSVPMDKLCHWIQGVGCASFGVARGLGYLMNWQHFLAGCAGSFATCKAHDIIQSLGNCHSQWVHYYQKRHYRIAFLPLVNNLPSDLLVPEDCQNR